MGLIDEINRKRAKRKMKKFFTRIQQDRGHVIGNCNWRAAKRAKFYAVSPSRREPCVWPLSRSYESAEETRARTSASMKVFPLLKCNEQ